MKLYQKIAQHIAHKITIENEPDKYPRGRELFTKTALEILETLPSGAGFDAGILLDYNNSSPSKIVLRSDFHHMNDNGYYCGWSFHTIVITPSLAHGFNVKVTGKDKRNIKDYISEFAYSFLNEE